jgi:Sulfotransferase domain
MAIPDPPASPPGWEVAPPDFVGVGALRSGTTWWWWVLISHPGVCFKRGLHTKEVHFFDALQDLDDLDAEDVDRYHRWFPRLPGTMIGEWTPRYMIDARTPHHIATAAPDARIMILLRDPVDRFASGYERAFVMARNAGKTVDEAEVAADQTARGFYSEQVQRVLDEFPRERILILQYERCRADYTAELRRTYEFLGLDPEVVEPPNAEPREPRDRPLAPDERERLAHAYAPDVKKLGEIAPEIDPDLWPSVRELV